MDSPASLVAVLALGAAVLGCGTQAQGPAPLVAPSSAAERCLIGRVAAPSLGQLSLPLLTVDQGAPIGITGQWAPTVMELVGTEVELCGTISGPNQLPEMQVRTVELRSVGSLQAYLGHVVRRPNAQWSLVVTPSQREIALSDVPTAIQSLDNKWVWVSGRWREARFAVVSFGVITPPSN